MTTHTVYAPEPEAKGELGRVMFHNGTATMDSDQHAAELRYCKGAGYTIDPPWPTEEEEAVTPVPEIPNRSASAAAWRGFAVSQGGMSREDAESLSRDDLAAHFTGGTETP